MSRMIDLTASDDEHPFRRRHRINPMPNPAEQADLDLLLQTMFQPYTPPKPFASNYKPKLSHPFKIQAGYSNSIIPPLAEDESNLNKTYLKANFNSFDIKNGKKVSLRPICGSCEKVLLQQTKLFGLRCGHVVCGSCLEAAKERVQQKKDEERKANWKYDIYAEEESDEDGYFEEDEVEVYPSKSKNVKPVLEVDNTTRSTRSQSKPTRNAIAKPAKKSRFSPYPTAETSKSKGKGKAKLVDTIDGEWLYCPLGDGCVGQKTDVMATGTDKAGVAESTGPFEIFV